MNKLISLSLLLTSLLAFNVYAATTQPVLSIVSQNLNRFFDDKNQGNKEKILTPKKYQQRVKQLVNKISSKFKFADVIALQEIENKQILQKISKLIFKKYTIKYQSILIEGNDVSGLDVGFLVKKSYNIKSVEPLFSHHAIFSKTERLFSRPPLLITLCKTECLTIVNVHLRSMRGLHSSKHRKRVSLKRKSQAETLARWINKFQTKYPFKKLLIIGDFNALRPSDHAVDSLGIILGEPDQKKPKFKSKDLIDNNLVDVSLRVKASSRYSYRYKRTKQLLDYMLVSKNLNPLVKTISFSEIDYKFSDHSALKAKIYFQ